MNTLRWILGIVLALMMSGYLLLFIVAGGFRRSFGASDNNPLLAIVPLAVGGLLLAALWIPTIKPLLHIAAVVTVGSIVFCLWILIRESATSLSLAILYLCLWLVFYVMALKANSATGSHPSRSSSSAIVSQTEKSIAKASDYEEFEK